MNTLKLTVIIPNYNHARFLNARVDSVLCQSFQDFEVLLMDDASTDDSSAIFAQYEHNPKIRVIKNVQNSGSPFIQWNKGVREAKGEFIWIAESDDYADSKFLETLVPVLEENPVVGIVYCQSLSVDESNVVILNMKSYTDELDSEHWGDDYINSGEEECRMFMSQKNFIPNASAVVFRKSVYLDCGLANESLRLCGDWLLWSNMLIRSDIAFISDPLNYFRRHTTTVRNSSSLNGVETVESYHVLHSIRTQLKIPIRIYEKSCDSLVDKWLQTMLHPQCSVPFFRLIRICCAAVKVDNKVLGRILVWLLSNPKEVWRKIKHSFFPPKFACQDEFKM